MKARSLSDELMDCVDRLGSEAREVDPRVWDHLLIYAPADKVADRLAAFSLALNVRHPDCHKAADAFWTYWTTNGETHKRGHYESTWGAINRAIRLVGVVPHDYGAAPARGTECDSTETVGHGPQGDRPGGEATRPA
jgi:hypothetical protein